MLVPLARIAVVLAALVACLVGSAAAQAGTCPDITVLEFGGGVYRGEPLPESAGIAQGGPLEKGVLDAPTSDDRCERERTDVTVVGLEGIDRAVAAGVEGRPGTIFVLGGKCFGFDGDARWACLREPLELDGGTYVATRYPDGPGTEPSLTLGAPLVGAVVRGEPVASVEIDGIDPSVAVGIAGSPEVAYVALGRCLYERFDRRPLYDDLRRCLEAPLWLVFEPAGAKPGDEVTATADRPLRPELEGATVSLARSTLAADVIPREAPRVVVFTIKATASELFTFTVPELEAGRYEAVLECDNCSTASGEAASPAGSFLVVKGSGASGGRSLSTIITIVIGVAFLAALALSIYMYRRGRALRRAAGGDPGADGGQQ